MEFSFLTPQWQAIKNVMATLSKKQIANIEWTKVSPPSTNVEVKFKKEENTKIYDCYGGLINNEDLQ